MEEAKNVNNAQDKQNIKNVAGMNFSQEQLQEAIKIAIAQQQNNNVNEQQQKVKVDEPLTITTVSDLEKYAKGNVLKLPDFSDGQPFVARLRRPSLLMMAKNGDIPNSLLSTANELFSKGNGALDVDNKNMLKDICEVMNIICESALVEPTYQQIKDSGMDLTDSQKMAIFAYTQEGVKALSKFH